tara:strand:+ start:2137 stop:2640 length:504 start_codon:yes stop_codon:yes gene_type:complete
MSFLKGTLGMIGGGMGAMALLNEGEGETLTSYPEQSRLKQLTESKEKENPLEFKKKQIESTYNYEFTERNNENNLSYMPEMYIKDNRLVVKLNDDAEKHAGYINNYAAQSAFGQDNRDIVYEIDGKKHAYDFSLLGGSKLIPIEEIENNPFTEGLPEGDQMMPEDFR